MARNKYFACALYGLINPLLSVPVCAITLATFGEKLQQEY